MTDPKQKEFYVYILFRPNGVPCYVGKGCGQRWMQKMKESWTDEAKKKLKEKRRLIGMYSPEKCTARWAKRRANAASKLAADT